MVGTHKYPVSLESEVLFVHDVESDHDLTLNQDVDRVHFIKLIHQELVSFELDALQTVHQPHHEHFVGIIVVIPVEPRVKDSDCRLGLVSVWFYNVLIRNLEVLFVLIQEFKEQKVSEQFYFSVVLDVFVYPLGL